MRGQGEPSGILSGKRGLSSVHGQPVFPSGGGGRSARRIGQLLVIVLAVPVRHLGKTMSQIAPLHIEVPFVTNGASPGITFAPAKYR